MGRFSTRRATPPSPTTTAAVAHTQPGLEITEYSAGDPLPDWMFPGSKLPRARQDQPPGRAVIPEWVTYPPPRVWDVLEVIYAGAGDPASDAVDHRLAGQLTALLWVLGRATAPVSKELNTGHPVTADQADVESRMASQVFKWVPPPRHPDPEVAQWAPTDDYRDFADGVRRMLDWLLDGPSQLLPLRLPPRSPGEAIPAADHPERLREWEDHALRWWVQQIRRCGRGALA